MTRLLALLLVVLALAGCGDERALQARVRELEAQLAEQQGQRQAELDEQARAASVAAACDWLVPTCPEAVAAPGRRALAAGVSPDALGLWLLAAKLAVLLLPVGLAVGLSGWAWARWSRPALRRAAEARALLAEADQRQARAQAEIERLRGVWAARRAEIEAAEASLAELRAEADRLRADVARLEELRRLVGGL